LHDATARARFLREADAGSQLVNRLQDLNYRVQTVNDLASLQQCARSEGPMLAVVDLESKHDDVCCAIAALKRMPPPTHSHYCVCRRTGGGVASRRAKSRRDAGGRETTSRITCRSF